MQIHLYVYIIAMMNKGILSDDSNPNKSTKMISIWINKYGWK